MQVLQRHESKLDRPAGSPDPAVERDTRNSVDGAFSHGRPVDIPIRRQPEFPGPGAVALAHDLLEPGARANAGKIALIRVFGGKREGAAWKEQGFVVLYEVEALLDVGHRGRRVSRIPARSDDDVGFLFGDLTPLKRANRRRYSLIVFDDRLVPRGCVDVGPRIVDPD